MKLIGHRVLLKKPVAPEQTLKYLSDKDKADVEAELIKDYDKLEVSEIGDEVTMVAQGDKVYVSSNFLKHAELINIDGNLFFLVADREIDIVW